MSARAAEDNHVTICIALLMFIAHILNQTCYLMVFVVGCGKGDIGIERGLAHRLILKMFCIHLQVLCAEGLSQRNQVWERAIVAAKRKDMCSGKVLRELLNIGRRGTTETVDCLIRIPYHPDALFLACQLA